MAYNSDNPQRALVLQGGGALGAYEAGVFQAIYSKIMNEDKNNGNRRLFHVIAGTSAGALNGAVLIDHFLKNDKSWEDADVALLNFWKTLRIHTIADKVFQKDSPFRDLWTYWHNFNPNIASAEAARRFWSVFQFDFTKYGVPNMYEPVLEPNYKFLNPFNAFNFLYDYRELRDYLSGVINFPLKTSFEHREPRLLVTGTDIQDYSSAVTFDSYQKINYAKDPNGNVIMDSQGRPNRYYTIYGEGTINGVGGGGQEQNKHIVFYDGIGLDQLLSSALAKYALDHPIMEDMITKKNRQFWDGGYLSNTPLRELIQSHKDYWSDYLTAEGKDGEVPDLELYIVDLHATFEKAIPKDVDSIDDREHDILFHNRTKYDEKVANIVSDYVNLAEKLIRLAKDKGASNSEIDKILNDQKGVKSRKRTGEKRNYGDLLNGRFTLTKIYHIERKDDPNSIFGKFTDFSAESIDKLIEDGREDANLTLSQPS